MIPVGRRVESRWNGDARARVSKLNRSLISDLPLFADLAPEALDQILAKARSMRVARETPVFEQEAAAHSFFLLLDGHVRVVKTTLDGQQVIVRYISAGEMIGIAQALGRSTYPATAIATVDCVVVAWPSHLWSEFAANFPSFGAKTYQTVGQRLEDAHNRAVELSTEQVEQRVARALLRLVKQTGTETPDGVLIDMPISRQHIAEMTGATLHTVSRLLSGWEQVGIVKGGRQKVIVSDLDRLRAIAEREKSDS